MRRRAFVYAVNSCGAGPTAVARHAGRSASSSLTTMMMARRSVSGSPIVLSTSTSSSSSSMMMMTSGRMLNLASSGRMAAALRSVRTRVEGLAMPVAAMTAGRTVLAVGLAVKAQTDQHAHAAQRLQNERAVQPIAELEHKKDEAQRALEEAKRKEAAGRPPEWYVILMGITGAIVGYFSALAFKFVGRYVLYFAAAETTALLMLTATGAITRNTAIEVAKFTMPPFEWALRTALDVIRGEFRRAFSSSSLSLRFFFLLSFGLTLRYSRTGPQGPFFFGRK